MGRLNDTGRTVLLLLVVGLAMTVIAFLRGQFDGAALLAAVSLTFAALITVWAATNRKRSQS